MLSKLTRASALTATLAAIFSIFANRIMLGFVPFCEDVSLTTQGRRLACPRLPIPRFRPCGRADAAATRIVVRPVRAGNRSRKFGSSVHSEVWQLSHADAGGSPKLLLRRAATESPNSTLLFALA